MGVIDFSLIESYGGRALLQTQVLFIDTRHVHAPLHTPADTQPSTPTIIYKDFINTLVFLHICCLVQMQYLA